MRAAHGARDMSRRPKRHQPQERKRHLGGQRWAQWWKAAAGAIAALTVAVVAVILTPPGQQLWDFASGDSAPAPGQRAAIVDQLSLTVPNPTFIATATDVLERAAYAVDYYPGEEVTVDFYRSFPERGYDLIIFRVHSATLTTPEDDASVSLFTGELYDSTRYLDEQADGRLAITYYYEGSPQYFGITAGFVESSMKGRFDDTMVIMMGCEGLSTDRAAQAFIDRGAKAFISWTRFVSASHTDAATERLLELLLLEQVRPAVAVVKTNEEVGRDPTYGSVLQILPPE